MGECGRSSVGLSHLGNGVLAPVDLGKELDGLESVTLKFTMCLI